MDLRSPRTPVRVTLVPCSRNSFKDVNARRLGYVCNSSQVDGPLRGRRNATGGRRPTVLALEEGLSLGLPRSVRPLSLDRMFV